MKSPFTGLIQKFDKAKVFESVNLFADQAQQAYKETQKLKIKSLASQVDCIVDAGMGGSALGAHIIQTACADKLKAPIIIINDYKLPAWVNSRTLVTLSSYSGTTEETLAAFKSAKAKKAKMLVICAGGPLAKIARANKTPSYIFNPRANPSKQPRIGLGYGIFGLLGLWKKVGLLQITETEILSAIQTARKVGARFNLEKTTSPIAKLTRQISGKAILVVGAEHLVGAAHVFANQFNETAKSFATWFPIPELNHHLMEGLTNPKINIRNTVFLMLNSKAYSPRIQKRMRLTKEVIQKNGPKVLELSLQSKTKLEQAIEAVVLGSNLTLGLGLQYHINPAAIRWVNYFKQKLGT
ncbi:MAG: SIS domain-containing protein [Patescibacteria group bacterium]|jgi:glucose/mannose-6-phosphate isomerase